MRKLLVVSALAVSALCLTASQARAANLTLTSAGSNVSGGVFIGPYTANIDGTSFQVICDDYASETYLYEGWTADVITPDHIDDAKFGGATAYGGSSSADGYNMVAYLATQLFDAADHNNLSLAADLQFAIWKVFDNAVSLTSNAQLLLNDAYAHRTDSSLLSDFVFYNPTGTTCTSGSCPTWPPQEFIAKTGTPEPATLSLLGLGASALFGARRRRRNVLA